MRVTAKVDYAVRAAIVLAHAAADGSEPVKGEQIRDRQDIPFRFCENILGELRQAGLVRSRRGAEGGYWLARPASEISIADIIRATEGPLANVRGESPEAVEYPPGVEGLQDIWIATRASMRRVLDVVTLGDVVAGTLPKKVRGYLDDPGAWERH